MATRGILFVIAAPSGAGKTSLVQALLEKNLGLQVSISHTTRPKRPTEKDGLSYHFVTEAVFQKMIAEGTFLEHAEVFGHYYGTSSQWVEGQLARGVNVLLEIDWQGAEQIRKRFPDCVDIFILPPSRAVLRQRLEGRGQDTKEVIQGRLAKAIEEMSHYASFNYLVVNDDFERALKGLESIIIAEKHKAQPQEVALESLICELLSP